VNEDKIDQRDGSVIDGVTGQSQNRLFDYIINFKNIREKI